MRGYVSRFHSCECLLPSNFHSPQPGQLEIYKEALERLNASIAFKSSEEDTTQAVGLNLITTHIEVDIREIRLA